MKQTTVLIIDFGAQYSQLIARRVREAKIYCEIIPYSHNIEKIKALNPKAIILSGGPASVKEEDAPKADPEIYSLGLPILGICYGGQLLAQEYGGKVAKAKSGEYGKTTLRIKEKDGIFKDLGEETDCWMSHFDYIEKAPDGFEITASSENCPVAAMQNTAKINRILILF